MLGLHKLRGVVEKGDLTREVTVDLNREIMLDLVREVTEEMVKGYRGIWSGR